MATKKGIGLYILCYLLIMLLIVVGFYSYSEGFVSKKAPSFCGTYGYTEKNITNPKEVSDVRKYTKSGCDALEDGVLRNGECLKVSKKSKKKSKKKDEEGEEEGFEDEEDPDAPIDPKDIKKNYSKSCAALNTQDTPQPDECEGIGRPNLEFKLTIEGKEYKIKPDMIMVYTENECETQLEGEFTSFKKLAKQLNTPIAELKKAAKPVSDEPMGLCGKGEDSPLNFSAACTGPASLLNTGGGGVSFWDKIMNLFK